MAMKHILSALSLSDKNSGAHGKKVYVGEGQSFSLPSPIDGSVAASCYEASDAQADQVIADAQSCFLEWRKVPAPVRGQIVREIGNALREKKEVLADLLSFEVGKIRSEALGEIQEAIDIADFACGLSRQLYGLSMHSERPGHRMLEQWHPLGPVGVITAFNFPVAVWAWNAMIAAVCGDTLVWKPSEHAPLVTLATNIIARGVAERHGYPALFSLVLSKGPRLGVMIAKDTRIPLVSATGSCRMGKSVAQEVAGRFGRSLLELGGNNALIVTPDADLDMAVRSIVFSAVGTAGQRCTSLRRVIAHESIFAELLAGLSKAYSSIPAGDPRDPKTLLGPLIHAQAVAAYEAAIAQVKASPKAKIHYGGSRISGMSSANFVQATLVEAEPDFELLQTETFAPILYLIRYRELDEAFKIHNEVPQGLSSAIFTRDIQAAEKFLSCEGSDCGIANVNIGPSGAEIGGAFGGEKETGGGRESGSDAWKQYMRRQTCTINYSNALPLAQGVKFEV